MRANRKVIVIIASVALCIVVVAVVTVYRPNRDIVIELEGPANIKYETVIIVDGQREEHTVTLPKTFRFHAREVFYRVTATDTSSNNNLSGHMYTEDKSIASQLRDLRPGVASRARPSSDPAVVISKEVS